MSTCVECSAKILSPPSISCSNCLKVRHVKCAKISKDEFDKLTKLNTPWYCIKCFDNSDSENILNLYYIKNLIIELKENFFEYKETVNNNLISINNKLDNIDEIIIENSKLKKEVSLLKNKLKILEKASISNEIIIDGKPEEKNENIPELMLKIATRLNIKLNKIFINDCYRVGSINHTKFPRRIIVKFIQHKEKIDFIQSRKVMRNFST
jgi:hypothetical protein